MGKLYDVIIAGGGPIGLFLACELGLAGVSVLVLERDLSSESPWKVPPLGRRGLNTPSVEAIYRRGLLGKLFDSEERPQNWFIGRSSDFRFGGHFAGILLNANSLDLERHKYRLSGPALIPKPTTIERIEKVLAERAESLGVTILRGTKVVRIMTHDANTVSVEAGEGDLFQGKWLVGCDGGRSFVRKAAGFDFVGTEPEFTAYGIECDLDHPERLESGFQITETGMYILGGTNALWLVHFDGGAFDRTQPITQEHLQELLEHISGTTEVKFTKIHRATAFTDRAMQTTTYRRGRILLAGDAAHIHSPLGAQGLNVGLGDAINLGWKLSAILRQESQVGEAPVDLTLLDTYESERHPIGAWVCEWSRAQVSTLQPNLHGRAARKLISDLINTIDGTNLFIERVWGLSQRYDLGCSHPLIGSSAPDFELQDDTRLGSKLEHGRGVLFDFSKNREFESLIVNTKHSARVDYICTSAQDQRGLHALLVRPDGIVAWAWETDSSPDFDGAKAALERWFAF